MSSMEFTVTVSGGLLGWEQKEILEQVIPDAGIRHLKSFDGHYHNITDVKVNLSFTDIDNLSNWFDIEWYSNFNLEIKV
ncbi:hypothetical protein NVP1063O_044 [Vibrio phage 1.063.O._10N.261.45.C7]|nr:hypothetical protein NVP1063O_044 [Vibrio phage 1.063.O._10N.261.45.C7]